MKTRAAVAMAAGQPLEVMEVDLEGPREGEVLVEIKATGVCHTDAFTLSGDDPEGAFPAILGHEGAGVVVETGPGVTSVAPGDHVIPLYTPECRVRDFCLNPKTNLCQKVRATQGQGLLPDGSTRFSMLDGTPIHKLNTKAGARRIALLPQTADAPAGLRVIDLVARGRTPHQTPLQQWSTKDEEVVTRALAQVGLSEEADRPVNDLSGGQRQRAWIAMVLAQDTGILLLDEPTTFLDLKVQVDLMTLLRRVAHDEGRTLVVVLHELNVAAAFADRLVMMKDGVVVAEGPVGEVFTEANLARVFGLDARVLTDPESGRPVCVPRIST